MTEQDWLVVAALLIVAVAVAYALGARRSIPPPLAGATSGDPLARVKPAEKKAVEKKAAEQKPVEQKPVDKQPVEKQPAEPPLAKLEYEEDDEIDPTRVGGGPAPKRAIYQPPVQRIVYDGNAEKDEPTGATSLFLVSATAETDTGLRRKRNEDSLLVLESSGLFVVADGMGGYSGGEVASQLAVTTIGNAFRHQLFEGEPHGNVPAQASELARAIQMANAAILETAKAKRELEGMGTTLCAARFSANKERVYIGHVGDSRCYRMREGTLSQMTADHTMADQGVKGPAAAHLSRAVGIWPTVPIDIVMGVPLAGDVYLLCSDGLTKMLDDSSIAAVLREHEDLKAAVERLIQSANERGGKDNITAILIRVVPPNWRPKAAVP